MKISNRLLSLELPASRSAFLWGPRKVGKTYWLTHQYPQVRLIDLLKTDTFAEYATRPSLLRERCEAWYQRPLVKKGPHLILDEIQKLPVLLDEVHWLIENRGISFLLTGSSARKLKRAHANLLGGRAWRRVMLPLTLPEIESFNLNLAMISGLLPPHLLSPNPLEDLRSYVADYLKEEVLEEAEEQELPAFSQFLRVAALTSGGLLDYTNVGREAGISSLIARRYFDLLEDTFLGFRIPPWRSSKKRRMILTEKFYLFDVGLACYLANRSAKPRSPDFGKAFEHFILMELRAFIHYRRPELPICFWRTSSGIEVDFILGEKELAVEIKASERVHEGDLKALVALLEDGKVKHAVVVCLEPEPRRVSTHIQILPWHYFLQGLWNNEWL